MLDAITRRLVSLALEEDIGPGDVTGPAVPHDRSGRAEILAKSQLVVAGQDVFREVFWQVDAAVDVHFTVPEGTLAPTKTVIGTIDGPARSLLAGERTALNFMQRLSGIATVTYRAVRAVVGTSAQVVDTRKTIPGMRALEKAAVRVGGGRNHRFGLFDGILIKDNHIEAAGSLLSAVESVRASAHHLMGIECEVGTLADVDDALRAGVDVILLDNMPMGTMREAVRQIDGRAKVEASGNVTLERLKDIAATGVDFISMGALTHSAPAADLSVQWVR